MPAHRLLILGLLVAFLAVVAIDNWRKRPRRETDAEQSALPHGR